MICIERLESSKIRFNLTKKLLDLISIRLELFCHLHSTFKPCIESNSQPSSSGHLGQQKAPHKK